MAKAKPGQNKNVQNAKQQLHAIKNGSVKKDKNPKFKNTPVGKVALINNSKAQNKNAPPQTNFQKGVKNNAKKSKQNPAKNKQNSSNRAQNKSAIKEIILTTENELEEIDDSDSDIDEETTLDDVSMTKLDETLEDEEGSDSDIPNILGKSLEDESDEDDEDFEEEEEEEEDDDNDIEEEMIEHKNIKTLKGVKPKAKKNEKTESDKNKELREVTMEDDDDEDDEDDDDEEDEEDEKEDENADLHKDILGKNLEDESDEDDDLEDEEEEDDDDDDDDDGNDDDIGTVEHKGIKMFKGVKSKVENNDEDENEEDEDEDEDEDDNDDNEDSALGLKALLGNSIIDEEDDEDFDEDDEDEDDEDDDISDEDEDGEENDNVTKVTKEKAAKASSNKDIPKGQKQVKEGEKKLSPEEQAEIDKRTIFINNIPKETKEAEIRKVFSKFGPINNLRFRNIIPQDSKMSKKVAAITKQIHPKVTTVVVYINYKSKESAQKALSMNGKIFEGNYIHVQTVGKLAKKEWDSKKAVFIGNLKFGIDNNTIWKHFSTCGEIESVHLIRDKKTGETKGFGYVNFKTEDSAVLALKLDGVEIMKRPVRVKPYISGDNKKGQKRVSTDNNDSNPRKKFKNNLEKPVACKVENEAKIKKHKKLQKNNAKPEEQKLISFQGQKADSKNKKKENKLDKKKKKMAKQLTAKSNKPVKV